VDCCKILADSAGRFIKVRLRDRNSRQIRTKACTYLEPDQEDNTSLIPESITSSDIVAGDMNQSLTELSRQGIYHYRNLEIAEILQIPRGFSDHPALLCTAIISTRRLHLTREIQYYDIAIVAENILKLIKALEGNYTALQDPMRTKRVNNFLAPSQQTQII
jgi:hypothetical protein